MDQMEKQVTEIREGLKELRETEERNSLAVQQALDVYEELKEKSEKTSMNTDQLFLNCKNRSKWSKKNLRSLWL